MYKFRPACLIQRCSHQYSVVYFFFKRNQTDVCFLIFAYAFVVGIIYCSMNRIISFMFGLFGVIEKNSLFSNF